MPVKSRYLRNVAGELFQQVTGIFALEEGEVAKDVDGVALVDTASPEVEQPLVVGRDIHSVGIRALGRVLEDVGMTEMQVGREIDLVCHIHFFCSTFYPYSMGKGEMLHGK